MIDESKPTHLDLFSGIGGFSIAFEAEGFQTIGFAETDKYASAVLRKHWPNVPNYGDVRNVPPGKYNVLTAGFPCQDASIAKQKAKGVSGSRTGLWFPTLEIIRRDRPGFVKLENVPALRTRGADEILLGLEESNYAAQAFVVGAWAAGAIQPRNRVWIFAYAREIGIQRYGEVGIAFKARQGGASCQENMRCEDWRTRPLLASRTESLLCRADDGIPNWVDRIGCLGNAVYPEVAQVFARAIRQLI
jgi:DNA (cytosine-5)-methyltransferase 1